MIIPRGHSSTGWVHGRGKDGWDLPSVCSDPIPNLIGIRALGEEVTCSSLARLDETTLTLRLPFHMLADLREWLAHRYEQMQTSLQGSNQNARHASLLYTGVIRNRILLSSLSAEYIRESTSNSDLPPARTYFCSVKSLSFSFRILAGK